MLTENNKAPQKKTCGCQCENKIQKSKKFHAGINFIIVFLSITLWFLIYRQLLTISNWIAYGFLALPKASKLAESLQFFFYDTPKVLMLLMLVIFLTSVLRSFVTAEKTRKILAGKSEFVGNISAALIGIITPFCSCSACPLFIGFVTAGVPLGVTFSFLISAPMINEIALILLYGLLGWKIAAFYLLTGLSIAIISGFIIGRLKLEKYVENWVYQLENKPEETNYKKTTWTNRFQFAWQSVKNILNRVWFFMILGIAVGAGIHGYVPQSLMASIMGRAAWWSVPLAVIIGIPMYSNAAGIIPIVEALLGKGAALGTTLAFMMSVIALSLPETVILRKVLKPQLLMIFIGVVTIGILLVGYLFNFII